MLGVGILKSQSAVQDAFVAEMAVRGYVQGRNLLLEPRDANSDKQSLESLAGALVALKVDVIVAAGGTPSVQAARRATATIPIVMVSSDPVRDALVDSLAHPGGNITGISVLGLELFVKRLQLVSEAVGKPKRIAYLGGNRSAGVPHTEDYVAALAAAASEVGAQFLPFLLDSIGEMDSQFERMAAQQVDALVIDGSPTFYAVRDRVAALAGRHRLPAIADGRGFADLGLLMTYGQDYLDLARQVAAYVDRILKGAKPGDLPIQQGSKFEMVVNLKTARSLGLTIPQSLLLRADDVIQ